ncbi:MULTISPECIES: HEAT repeat domain-containing protein [Streptomyces]
MEPRPSEPDLARMRVEGEVAGLCRAARSDDDATAQAAVALLGDLGDPAATETLTDCVEPPGATRFWVFREAVAALGRLRDRRAVPALLRFLDGGPSPDRWHQEDAVFRALGSIGGPDVVRVLVDRLTRENPSPAVLDALTELRPPEAVTPLLVALWGLLPADAARAARLLGTLGDPRAGPALLFLAHAAESSAGLRRAAVEALGHLPGLPEPPVRGRPSEDRLRRALRDPDAETARCAAELLSRTPEGRRGLRGTLKTAAHHPGRPEAPPSAVLAVCDLMARRPELVDAGFPEGIDTLVLLLRQAPASTVRRAAARTLGVLGGRQAVDALLAALGDERVGEAVAGEVSRLRVPPVGKLLALVADGDGDLQRRGAARALGLLECAEAAPLLMAALDDAEAPKPRVAAADALGMLRHRPAAERLAAVAADEAEPGTLRARAVHALGLIGAPESLPVLLACVRSPKEPVRLRAVEALGGFPVPEAADALGPVVARDADRASARAALRALGRIGAPALPVLASLAERLRTDVAGELIAALAGCPGPGADAALERLAVAPLPEEVHVALARALGGRRSPGSAAALAALLADGHPYRCSDAALRALAALGTEEAAEHVLAYCRETGTLDEGVREALDVIAEQRGTAAAPGP